MGHSYVHSIMDNMDRFQDLGGFRARNLGKFWKQFMQLGLEKINYVKRNFVKIEFYMFSLAFTNSNFLIFYFFNYYFI